MSTYVDTPYGEVKVKNSYLHGEKIKFKPEYEDLKKIAEEKNIPLIKLYNDVLNIINRIH